SARELCQSRLQGEPELRPASAEGVSIFDRTRPSVDLEGRARSARSRCPARGPEAADRALPPGRQLGRGLRWLATPGDQEGGNPFQRGTPLRFDFPRNGGREAALRCDAPGFGGSQGG